MSGDEGLHERTLTEVGELIRRRELSPVELTRATLERIERLDAALHSYITVAADRALEQARTAEREIAAGAYRGPLHGVPVAVKDLCDTRGVRTTYGSQIFADRVPDEDAACVARLDAAGAVLLGKLSLTEFAGIGYHPTVAVPTNPWDADRWTGTSSSGCGVATAAGLCFASLGTDTGGSLRFPAAACGTVGLKPTYGRVSRRGVFPLAESLDHVGPITRSVADAAVVLGAIAGFDAADPTTRRGPVPDYRAMLGGDARGLRIGVDRTLCTSGVEPEVGEAVLAATTALADLGASIRDVTLAGVEEAVGAWGTIFTAECGAAHEATFPARAGEYSPAFRGFLEMAPSVRGIDYAKAHAVRQVVRRTVDDLFEEVDVLVFPTMAVAPMAIGGRPLEQVVTPELGNVLLRFTSPFSLTGHPALAVPCGFTAAGLPLSLELVGRRGDEATVLRVGHAYEQAAEWHRRRPPV